MAQSIVTNNQSRYIIEGYELTAGERSQFDWMDDPDVEQFVRYRGEVIALSEFERVQSEGGLAILGWDGVHADSYFSGTLIQISPDGESVKLARIYS